MPLEESRLAPAQHLRPKRFTLEGDGGTSTGGVGAVSSNIGDPGAGRMSGGQFTLEGGFWGLIAAMQTDHAPHLTVVRTATNTVVVSWPIPTEGWLLHATTKSVTGGTAWTELPPPYQTRGTTSLFFDEPSPVGNKFYRLHKP